MLDMFIDIWLTQFKEYWLNKDIDSILTLFADQIEYRENPYDRYIDKDDIKNLWTAINTQDDIKLNFEIFSVQSDKYTVIWSLQYDRHGKKNNWKGVYLIKMNDNDKCNFFMQIGERLPDEV